jgi:hypothetical protein
VLGVTWQELRCRLGRHRWEAHEGTCYGAFLIVTDRCVACGTWRPSYRWVSVTDRRPCCAHDPGGRA